MVEREWLSLLGVDLTPPPAVTRSACGEVRHSMAGHGDRGEPPVMAMPLRTGLGTRRAQLGRQRAALIAKGRPPPSHWIAGQS